MRGTQAKRIRAVVYGADLSPRQRTYQWNGPRIIADPSRQLYQQLKRRKAVLL